MTTYTGVIQVMCNGPRDGECPYLAGKTYRGDIEFFRDMLRQEGWEIAIPIYDQPAEDRCPRCGKGTT